MESFPSPPRHDHPQHFHYSLPELNHTAPWKESQFAVPDQPSLEERVDLERQIDSPSTARYDSVQGGNNGSVGDGHGGGARGTTPSVNEGSGEAGGPFRGEVPDH